MSLLPIVYEDGEAIVIVAVLTALSGLWVTATRWRPRTDARGPGR